VGKPRVIEEINKNMNEQNNQTDNPQPTPERKPDDSTGFNVDGFVKIVDPDTGEVLLATRG